MAYEEIILTDDHRYIVNGQEVPGVTSIIKAAGLNPDWSMVRPGVLEQKADLGSKVHEATELFDLGILNMETLDPLLAPYIEGWKAFKDDVGFEAVEPPELKVYSSTYNYAGTLDRFGMCQKKLTLLDIKTQSVVYLKSVGPQTAGYEQGLREWAAISKSKKIERAVVKLMPNGKYKFIKCDNPNDLNIFLYGVQLYWWNQIKHPTG